MTWKREDGKSGKPKSYLLSLLVITAYRQLAPEVQTQYFRALANE